MTWLDLTPYAGYIVPAYLVSGLGLGIATVWTLAAWRKAKIRLAGVEHK
jgi:hypothetical protein